MAGSRRVLWVLAALTGVLALAAISLVFGNPSVHARSTGQDYPCLAPYDIVLNHAGNNPDGFPPLRGEHISARCDAKGHDRFHAGLVAGAAAVALALLTSVLAIRRAVAGRRVTRHRSPSDVVR